MRDSLWRPECFEFGSVYESLGQTLFSRYTAATFKHTEQFGTGTPNNVYFTTKCSGHIYLYIAVVFYFFLRFQQLPYSACLRPYRAVTHALHGLCNVTVSYVGTINMVCFWWVFIPALQGMHVQSCFCKGPRKACIKPQEISMGPKARGRLRLAESCADTKRYHAS